MAARDETTLSSGGLRPVTRTGRTVRRPAGPWTPAVHALLGDLEEVGFDGAPRPRGIDDEGREVLTFVEGDDSHHARDETLHSDHALGEVARLVRRFHDAVAGFEPPVDAAWQYLSEAPRDGIVCHNDLAPVNAIFRHGQPVAFIDWDYAAPAPRVWDVACAVSSFVPLLDDEFCRRHGYSLAPRGPRLRLFCDAYGLEGTERETLLDVLRNRELAMYETVRRGAEAGHPTYAAVWAETKGRRWLDIVGYQDDQRRVWQSHLS